MKTIFSAIFSLLVSFAMLSLGHGLLSSLISVRAAVESFSNLSIGFMGFFYFFGFVFGIYLCSNLLSSVGHIRTFAAAASITSAISISFLLSVNPISWMLFRFAYGICIASLYMVIESWLNSMSTNEHRAQILSVYMITIYSCFAVSQFMLNLGSFDSFMQFLIVSILLSVSVVPLCISTRAKTADVSMETLPLKKVIKASPYGIASCIIAGVVVGSIWSMMGAFLEIIKIQHSLIPVYLSMIFFGVLIFQYPLGKLSDNILTRQTILKYASIIGAIAFLTTAFAITYTRNSIILSLLFLFLGGFSFPLYSIAVAYVVDHVEAKYIIRASGSLLLLNAAGSMLGSILCSLAMQLFTPNAILYFCGIFLIVNFILSFILKQTKPETDIDTPFIAYPRTTTVLQTLDPRVPEEVLEEQSQISTN